MNPAGFFELATLFSQLSFSQVRLLSEKNGVGGEKTSNDLPYSTSYPTANASILPFVGPFPR